MNPTGKVLKLEENGKLLWFSPVDDDLTIDELIKKFDRPKYARTYQPFKPNELNIKAYERGWCL